MPEAAKEYTNLGHLRHEHVLPDMRGREICFFRAGTSAFCHVRTCYACDLLENITSKHGQWILILKYRQTVFGNYFFS